MTAIVTMSAAATGDRFLLTVALTYWLVRLGDTARSAPNEISTQPRGLAPPSSGTGAYRAALGRGAPYSLAR